MSSNDSRATKNLHVNKFIFQQKGNVDIYSINFQNFHTHIHKINHRNILQNNKYIFIRARIINLGNIGMKINNFTY